MVPLLLHAGEIGESEPETVKKAVEPERWVEALHGAEGAAAEAPDPQHSGGWVAALLFDHFRGGWWISLAVLPAHTCWRQACTYEPAPRGVDRTSRRRWPGARALQKHGSATRLQGQGTRDFRCTPFQRDKYDVTCQCTLQNIALFHSYYPLSPPAAHPSSPLWCLRVIRRHPTSPTPRPPPDS
ncbi:unnamed protein product [Pleuronectes platessa]|uniref:Uncharacterized protein n=1 Tax=Pleuronectes platessa TaxID=8262 RepID=A0A9N7V4Y6_PLEPL|nr:unnamed protein product [Pleuronectes platessa]